MILAAGRGERLRPLTDHTPKPLIEIGGEPLIVHQLRWVARAGVVDVVVNLHHLAEKIRARVGSGKEWGVRVRYSVEETLLETGGGIVRALPMLGDAPFLVLNGDIWTDYSFSEVVRRELQGSLHLVLTATPEGRDGDFDLVDGYVVRGDTRPLTYCGISIVSPALFADAPSGPFSLRDYMFSEAAKRRVTGERFDGRWTDIGTPEQLRKLRRLTDYS
jgi:MurNAc alpha-1-phosphate uridylyltransferase